jgi:hypothetical protein
MLPGDLDDVPRRREGTMIGPLPVRTKGLARNVL